MRFNFMAARNIFKFYDISTFDMLLFGCSYFFHSIAKSF